MYDAKKSNQDSITLWGTGNARRELMHVEDCANISIRLAKNYDLNGSVNVGCGKDYSIKELSKLVAQIVGFNGKILFDNINPDGTMKKCTDTSIINNMGIYHSIKIEDGIKEMLNIYINSEGKNLKIKKSY